MEKMPQNLSFARLSGLHNPFLLNGMKEALDRIVEAVNYREKIVVYGYGDLDGITAVSLLLLVLKYLNADVEYYIADFADENRSIKEENIKNNIMFLGASLIVTVSCEIEADEQLKLCQEMGIDIIITDYHISDPMLEKEIVINPTQKNCIYPFKKLSGVGVAYKFAEAISSYYEMNCIKKYLDLVMLGTLSKNKPIVNENKAIVNMGIRQLACTNNFGLKALMKSYNIKKIDRENINELIENIRLTITSSRKVDNARIVVEILTTTNKDRAEQIAKYLKNEIKVCKIYAC
jgi:single-stranded DNA-specific DHH superfamily exonuclease